LDNSVYFFNLLKTKGKHIHRGELLAKVVAGSPVSVTKLAKRMGISRGTYYNHVDIADLPFELLERYGKILKYDFSADFPDMKSYTFEEPIEAYGEPPTIEEAIRQRDHWKKEADKWKDKYIALLEGKE
jgi:hypothetical protein